MSWTNIAVLSFNCIYNLVESWDYQSSPILQPTHLGYDRNRIIRPEPEFRFRFAGVLKYEADLKYEVDLKYENNLKQAGAELGQAQLRLGLGLTSVYLY